MKVEGIGFTTGFAVALNHVYGHYASYKCNLFCNGKILREEWDSVGENNVSDFPRQTLPTSTSQLTAFEGPSNIGGNYASFMA